MMEVFRGPVSSSALSTFSVVQDSLHENRVLGESLRNQQDALLNTMATQQGATANTLQHDWKKEETDVTLTLTLILTMTLRPLTPV